MFVTTGSTYSVFQLSIKILSKIFNLWHKLHDGQKFDYGQCMLGWTFLKTSTLEGKLKC